MPVTQEGAGRILALQSAAHPEIRNCRIYYDTLSYRLHRAEIEWWKDLNGQNVKTDRIWLAKVNYTYRSRGNVDIGQEMRRYIVGDPGGLKATEAYAGYTVHKNF